MKQATSVSIMLFRSLREDTGLLPDRTTTITARRRGYISIKKTEKTEALWGTEGKGD
jgi:hypothetical protein